MNSFMICIKQFEDKYSIKSNSNQRFRTIKKFKPIPRIFNPKNSTEEGQNMAYWVGF